MSVVAVAQYRKRLWSKGLCNELSCVIINARLQMHACMGENLTDGYRHQCIVFY